MGIFAFFNGIQHIVLYGVLALELEDETVLEFVGLTFVGGWHLELSMRLLDFFADCLETLGGHHKGLSGYGYLFGIFIDWEVISDLVFFFF